MLSIHAKSDLGKLLTRRIPVPPYSKEIKFDGIVNCRDIGDYKTEDGRTVAWRRLFRSGYLHPATEGDLNRLKEELKLTSVINLRRNKAGQQKEVTLPNDAGIKYFNTPFFSYQQEELNLDFTNMGGSLSLPHPASGICQTDNQRAGNYRRPEKSPAAVSLRRRQRPVGAGSGVCF
jgi:hypothetical protein